MAVDTSVAVPLVLRAHPAHADVVKWWDRRELALCGQAVAETYSVLTRLPGDLRLSPADAARLLGSRFEEPVLPDDQTSRTLPETLAGLGIAGGAVYDALVALAARDRGCVLATRDARARATYDRVGVDWVVV
ncbi:MAG: type II toxin-antitoxin system VapC family toxin [Nocardioides sp.]